MKLLSYCIFALLITIEFASARGIVVRPFITNSDLELHLRPRQGGDGVTSDANPHTYTPNVSASNGVTIGWDGLSITFARQYPQSDASIQEKGETDHTDYQLQLFFDNVGIDLFFQQHKSFYRSTATEAEKTVLPNTALQFPILNEMEMKKYGVNIFYVFDPKGYDMQAAWNQTTRQTRSGWSWITMLGINDVNISNKGTPILPSDQRAEYGVDSNFNGARMKSISASLGIGFNLMLYDNFFLAGQGAMGWAFQQFLGRGTANEETQNIQANPWNLRLTLGYNGPTYFIGVQFMSDSITTETDTMEIEPESNLFYYFVGMRF